MGKSKGKHNKQKASIEDKYEIVEEFGEGGNAIVYKVKDKASQNEYALKCDSREFLDLIKRKHQWVTDDPVKRERMIRVLREVSNNRKGRKTGKPSVHRVPVSVYDKDGNFVAVCRHIHEAAERFGTNPYNVSACIHGRRRTAGNHQFRKAKVEEYRGMQLVRKSPIEKLTGRLSYKRAVAVYDLDGAYLGLCESVARAAREYGVSEAGIKQCLSGRSKRSGLYQFRDAYAGIDV